MALSDFLHPAVLNALARQAAAQPAFAGGNPFTVSDLNAPRSLQVSVNPATRPPPPPGWLGSYDTPTVVGGQTITRHADGSSTVVDNATGITATLPAGDYPPSPGDPTAYIKYQQTPPQMTRDQAAKSIGRKAVLPGYTGPPTGFTLPPLRDPIDPSLVHDPPVIVSAAPPVVTTKTAPPAKTGKKPPPPAATAPVIKIVGPKTTVIKGGGKVTIKPLDPLKGYTTADYLKYIAPDQKNVAADRKILAQIKLPDLNALQPQARLAALQYVKLQVQSIRASQQEDRAAGIRQARYASADAATQARYARQDAAAQARQARQDAATQAAADRLDATNQANAVFAAGRAAAQLFQGMAPGIADVYAQAGRDISQMGAGFSGAAADQGTAAAQAVANQVNQATGGSYSPMTLGGVNVQGLPAGAAAATNLSQGVLPGSNLAAEAARQYTNATLNIPRQFTGEANLQGAGTLAAGRLAAAKALAAGGVTSARALQAGGIASQRALAAGGTASQRALAAGETAAEALNAQIRNAWGSLPTLTKNELTTLVNNANANFNARYKLAQGNLALDTTQMTKDQQLWFQMAGLNVKGRGAENTFAINRARLTENYFKDRQTYYHQVNQDAIAAYNAATTRSKAVSSAAAATQTAAINKIKAKTALTRANTAQLQSKIAWHNAQHPESKIKESSIAAWVNKNINQTTTKGGPGQAGEIFVGTVQDDLQKAANAIVNEFPGFFGDGSTDPNVVLSDAMRFLVGAQKHVPVDPVTQKPFYATDPNTGKTLIGPDGKPVENTFFYQYGQLLAEQQAAAAAATTPSTSAFG